VHRLAMWTEPISMWARWERRRSLRPDTATETIETPSSSPPRVAGLLGSPACPRETAGGVGQPSAYSPAGGAYHDPTKHRLSCANTPTLAERCADQSLVTGRGCR
jgi:hypothetical protein